MVSVSSAVSSRRTMDVPSSPRRVLIPDRLRRLASDARIATNISEERGVAIGRLAVASLLTLTSILYLGDTLAYVPMLTLVVVVALYGSLTAVRIWSGRTVGTGVPTLTFILDNMAILAGWLIVAGASTHIVQVYLVIMPLIVTGVVRLGGKASVLYILFWLGCAAWIDVTFYPAGNYSLEQMTVRLAALALPLWLTRGVVWSRFREIKRVAELKSALLNTVSHELKTPLTSIRGAVELLSCSHEGPRADSGSALLTLLTRNVDQLERIVEAALRRAKLENGNNQTAVAPTDVRELISETAALVGPSITLKSQQLSMDLPADLPNVLMDRELTEQAILNLVNNASKYTPEAGQISVRAFRHRSNVTVEVSDTGPGIPEKEFPFLFEEFYRGERADTKGTPGDGLGLAIAKQAVEQQGGTIAVRSMLGQGTTFSVTLPCGVS